MKNIKRNINQLDINNLDFLSQIQKNKLNEQIKYSFGFNSDFHKQIIKELNIYTKNSWLARHLYSIIDSNISLPENINNKKRNKLLRPLFKEIVCKMCYPNVFDKSYSSKDLNTQVQNFLDYIQK